MILEIEATPALSEPELEAVRLALVRLGVELSTTPPIGGSGWQMTAAREALDNRPPRPHYARSPRSTRGATRA